MTSTEHDQKITLRISDDDVSSYSDRFQGTASYRYGAVEGQNRFAARVSARAGAFSLMAGGAQLMTSFAHGSEEELARLGCAPFRQVGQPRVLIGGLGLGYNRFIVNVDFDDEDWEGNLDYTYNGILIFLSGAF